MEHLSEKRKLTIMIAIMAAMFFSAINQTIIGVAMPRIIAKLGGMDYYTWAITIYLLTSTVATVLVGKLSDIYGRKPFILTGIALFMLGAFLCGFSADIFQLIAFRGIQGMGAGIIMSTAFTAVGDLYAPRERAKWMGIMSGVFGLSSVLGPPLGGYLVDHLDWRWVFWMFLPLGIIAFFMIISLFPKVERKVGESIDYWGSVFLTTTIVPLLLAFSWAGDGAGKYAWGSWQIIGLFSATLVSLIIFILVEMKVKSPVLPLSLFRNGIVTVSNLAGFVLNAGMMGAIIYVPFFVQGVKGISPTYSGYVTMPMSVVMILCTAFIGQFISKTGKYKKMAIGGLLIMTFGMVLLHFMTPDTAIYITIIYMCIVGLGLGISMPVFSLTIQNAVEPQQLGVATASSQLFRSLGGTIGIAVMGTVMNSHMTSKMTELGAASGAAGGQMQIDPKYAESLKEVMNPQTLLDQPKLESIINQLPPELQTMVDNLVHMVREALSYGVTSTFLTGAIVTAVAVILTFFLKEIPLRSAKDVKVKQGDHAGEARQQVIVNSKS
ncbi:MFS transporter [Paenibacillus thiaminolyticus]|uniref:MFS transporter n=1 Tax=Paenibacillus thiaminolyticus TaxID=49283 RepID=A0AAP9DRN3_PANTH|nr:MDR family MFS transporter [Paenibacillus thiaminolyticus]MCY9538678.1 MFS transporter [Paenibacillus thiaminolyticus]MCY9602401.1 MFS transporter [Paenibacillus thiaminolyticus]MCY9610899.1 MFS transporter [Paenibacillus thiaminolyticus]MCY9613330.1 MFS transporter [Paenibacillus thiaminolyticus]MCY9619504.1 MFS transporter [Paenibacillus thiaminolyticus]